MLRERAVLCFLLFVLANAGKVGLVYFLFGRAFAWPHHMLVALAAAAAGFGLLSLPGRRWFLVTGYAAQQLFYFMHVLYFLCLRQFFHFSFGGNLFFESVETLQKLALPYEPQALIVLIDAPLFAVVLLVYPSLRATLRGYVRRRTPAALTLLAIVLPVAASQAYVVMTDPRLPASEGAFVTYEVRRIRKYGLLLPDLRDQVRTWLGVSPANNIRYGRATTRTAPATRKMNVLMIQVESLGAESLNAKVDDQPVMPFLRQLAADNVYFPYLLSYHFAGGTSDCEVAVLNSIEPLTSEPTMKLYDYGYPNSLVKRLETAGYHTLAFHGNRANFFDRDRAYTAMGFDVFAGLKTMRLREVGWGAPDHEVLGFIGRRIGHQSAPFFYYVITMSSHEPFAMVARYFHDSRYDAMPDPMTRGYLSSMAYVDGALRAFFARLRSSGVLDNTYVFVYGDHTPCRLSDQEYHRAVLHAEGTEFEFVPLIIVTPDHQRHQERDAIATYLDLAPTVLAAAGIPYRLRTDGCNLLAPLAPGGMVPFRDGWYLRRLLFGLVEAERHSTDANPVVQHR